MREFEYQAFLKLLILEYQRHVFSQIPTAYDHRIVSLKNDVDVVIIVVNDKNVVNVVNCRKLS
jgi:hypothetical protein